MPNESRNVEPLRIADRAVPIAGRDHLDAALVQFLSDDRADISKPLNNRGRFLRLDLHLVHCLEDTVRGSAAGCLTPADAAAEFNGLAGHDFGTCEADLH